MTEYDVREELFNRDFLQGFLNEKIVYGLTMTPLIPKQELKHDTFTSLQDDGSVEESIAQGSQHKPRLVAEGAVLEEIRVDGFTPKTGRISKRGYRITLSENILEREPTEARSILNRMGRLAYGLGRWVEEIVWTTMKAEAIAGGITNVSADPIVGANAKPESGIIDYQMAYDLDDYSQELNTMIYHKKDLGDFRKKLNDNEVVTQNRLVEGWKNGRAFDYLDVTHMKGNMFQAQDELIGFDRNLDWGTVFYTKEKRGYNPKVKTGMENFAPILNVTLQEPEPYDVYGNYVIRMLTGAGLAVDSPQALLYDNGLSS
jgi:hypothetical protein